MTWGKVQDSFMKWQEQILSADQDTRKDIIKAIIRQCLDWILEDVDTQKQRIFAMRMAATIIDTKLRYSGILEGAGAGNIYIQPAPQEPEEDGEGQDKLSEKSQLHIVGKGEDYEG
ncbi:unnamed protein product [marine sediment metagenome]|uniref:Uncharacterized protein n=1 Tax=marine sediment metagenome TaxID=412755 RepID=X0YLR8_9ZZZZ